ncbi:MAG: hypothetical protein K0U82_19800 [Planctomycetes bacterium]|nr:hypothetical protein [Planctomycetota bacterium]
MANSNIQPCKNNLSRFQWHRLYSRTMLWLFCFTSGMFLSTLPGCGTSTKDIGRLPVTGTVVRENSTSVVNGTISFLPKGKGPAATTQIRDGAYQFNREDGPIQGEYRVLVSSQADKSPTDSTTDPDEANVVSRKVNSTEWTFSTIIMPDARELSPFVLEESPSTK